MIGLLFVAAALAGPADLSTCCEAGHSPSCPDTLTAVGPGTQRAGTRLGIRLTGLWNLSCEQGVSFLPHAERTQNTSPPVGQLLDAVSPEALSCFEAACPLPPDLCLEATPLGPKVQSCSRPGTAPFPAAWTVADVTGKPTPGTPTGRPTRPAVAAASPPAAPRTPVVATPPATPRPAPEPAPVAPTRTVPARTAAAAPPSPASDASTPPSPPARPSPAVAPTAVASAATPPPAPPSAEAPAADPTLVHDDADAALPPAPPVPCTPRAAVYDAVLQQIEQGDEARAQGNTSAAEGHYRAALTIDACNAFAWAGLGEMTLADDQPELAERCFTHATRIFPRHHRAWTQLGTAYEALGAPEMARTAYYRALSLDPDLTGPREALVRLQHASR